MMGVLTSLLAAPPNANQNTEIIKMRQDIAKMKQFCLHYCM